MRTLRFVVSGQTLHRDPTCSFEGLASGSVGYLRAAFALDGAWKGCKAAASFWLDGKEYAAPVVSGECDIPAQALKGRLVGVSLTGVREGYRITTGRVYFRQEVI